MNTTDEIRQRLAEVEAREQAATEGPWATDGAEIYQGEAGAGFPWVGETLDPDNPEQSNANASFAAHARADVPWLVDLLKQYVGFEPTVLEELEHSQRCLNSVYDLIDEAKRTGQPIDLEALEQAADGDRPAPTDNRRRLYLDGKGHAWIDHYRGEDGTQYVTSITDPWRKEQSDADVRATTGGLREIGRTS